MTATEPIFGYDTYGEPIDPKVSRHDKCECEAPCQKRFRCRSRHHQGNKQSPYCQGGDGESCNEGWYRERQRVRALRIRVVSVQAWEDPPMPARRRVPGP